MRHMYGHQKCHCSLRLGMLLRGAGVEQPYGLKHLVGGDWRGVGGGVGVHGGVGGAGGRDMGGVRPAVARISAYFREFNLKPGS